MNIVCLDMEGVLVPEIWIAFARESGIPELSRTTRDEPDYNKLMDFRPDRPHPWGKGVSGRAAVPHPGHHPQRHL